MSDKNNEQQIKNLENINDLNDKRITAEKQLFGFLRKNSKELETSDKKHTKAMEAIVKSQRSFNQTLRETKDLLRDTIGIFVSWNFASDLLAAAKGVVAMEKSLYRASINAGKTAEEGKKVVGIAAQMRMNFGATAEDAEKVLKTFVKGQYKGNIEKAASASYQFARAMDISQETVSKNTLELQKWGQIGPEAATAMYTDIMKVAQGYGMTSEGAEGVIKTTTKLSGYMRAFGKSETQIQKMNLGFAKMVSSMEKVGVSAQDALAMVEQLLDPEKIEENIPAYAALGISITDAINGNIDSDQITAGMKEVGNKLKEMGPIAGAAYAKAMGISYKNAIKSADLEEITEEAMTPQDTAAEQMKQLTENTKNMTEKINDLMNKFQGLIQGLGPVAMVVLGGLLPKIVKIIGNGLFKSVKDSLKNGMAEGAKEGVNEIEKNDTIKIMMDIDLDPKSVKKAMRNANKADKELKKSLMYNQNREKALQKINELEQKNREINASQLDDQERLKKAMAKTRKELIKLEYKPTNNNREKAIQEQKNLLREQEKELRLIEKQGEQFNENKKEIDKIKDALKEVGNVRKKTFKEAFEQAKRIAELRNKSHELNKQEGKKVSNNFFAKLAFNSKRIATGAAKKIGDGLLGAGKTTANLLSKIKIKVAKTAGGIAGSKVGSKIGSIVAVLGKLAGPVAAVVAIVTAIIAILKKNEKMQELFAKIVSKINEILQKAVEPLIPVFETLINIILGIIDKLKPLIDMAVTIVKIIVQVLAPILELVAAILEPLMPIIEILTIALNMILELLKVPLMILIGLIKVITKPLEWTANILQFLADHILKQLLGIVQTLVKKITELIRKIPFVGNAMADAIEGQKENTEATKQNTEATTEAKPAQIKRNSDGTLSSTMATVKREDEGASKQNTATETRVTAIANEELKQKLDTISSNLFNLSAIMEKYFNYNLIMEQKRNSNEDSNLKKQSQVMKESIKNGIESVGTLSVSVKNFPKENGSSLGLWDRFKKQ